MIKQFLKHFLLSTDDSTARKNSYEEFLIAEYNNIAHAHFNTVTSISQFFKHYLLIVSVPVSIAVLFLKPAELKAIAALLDKHPLVPAVALTIVSVLGACVLGYMINLRCDAILYARTVNGIRKYFSETSGLTLEEDVRFRVLPKSAHLPPYFEGPYFLFVVLTFAIVGTTYFSAGWYFYWIANNWQIGPNFWLLVASAPWLHLFIYAWLSQHRERRYLRGHIVGVDVDGVLNKHRTHFAEVLKEKTNKTINPTMITRIPVHEISNCTVTEMDEHAVFNWPRYWNEMPVLEHAENFLRKIKNLLGYRIWIFTHRGWPQPSTFPAGKEDEYWQAWRPLSWWAIPSRFKIVEMLDSYIERLGIPGWIRGRLMSKITRRWLGRHAFKYDKLIVERGNTNTVDPVLLTRNRFLISKEKMIRAFVEDDFDKAKKLADICEVVFLMDHPYNQGTVPMNVIRVQSWQEVYDFLRRVF